MRAFLAAVSMLSCIPLGKFVPTEKELARAPFFFPLAGLLFAALFCGITWGCVMVLPPVLAGAVLVFAPELLTKGFHIDGLADTADGFWSGRDRERKLEIMHDSRIGTMGVLAIVALFFLKFAAVLSILSEFPRVLTIAIPLMILNGRCAMVHYIFFSRYARQEGLGKRMFEQKSFLSVVTAFLFSCLCILWAGVLEWIFLLPPLLLGLAFLWSRITERVIGGATGDTIGACEELSELFTLFFFAILTDFSV